MLDLTRGNELFLKEFHSKYPSCTPNAFILGKTLNGLSSYEALANIVPADEKPVCVLDLACGDGYLLQKLFLRNQAGLDLAGVDMSVGELNVARQRLSNSSVKILEGNAKSLPFPDSSFDYVLCHMALMLMDEVDRVVREIHRVLKPGGIFSAIVGGKYKKNPVKDVFINLLIEALKHDGKIWNLRLGDPRLRDEGGIRSVFDLPQFFEQPVEVSDVSLNFKGSPESLMPYFMLMYNVSVLSEKGRTWLEGKLSKALTNISGSDGSVTFPMTLRQITCKGV